MHELDPTVENRNDFVSLISSLMKKANLHGEMVFDTPIHHDTVYPHQNEDPPLVVSYAPTNLEADDLIVEKLYAISNPVHFKVVTSDRDLAYRVKELEVKVLKVDAFLSLLEKKNKKKAHDPKPSVETKRELERLEQIFLKKLEGESE